MLGDKFSLPDKVIINNETQENILPLINFEKTNNIIQLIWNEPRENWGCLFHTCIDIVEIDFSQFNFSQSIKGNAMLYDCKSVTSININDFGKVKIKDGGSFFRGMESLTSLNLSNFDISEATDIGCMFNGCSSLISLNLSNFQGDNINVHIDEYIFTNCPKLEYVNFKNLRFIPRTSVHNIYVKKNIVFCTEDTFIILRVEGNRCPMIDCTDNWRLNQKKINLENDQCIENCSLTDNNKYNYKGECYANCPNKTYNDNYTCEDCHPDCQECIKAPDIISANCKVCSGSDKYLNFGNCYKNDEYINEIFITDYANFNNILENIIDSYLPENDIGNGLVIKREDNIIYHITNSKNEIEILNDKSKNSNNISIIDLAQCETIIRNEYHINDEDSLIFVKKEAQSNKASEKNVSFEVYESSNKTKLNISLCDGTPINIYLPIELSEGIKQLYEQMKESGYDMFDINDPFYQDICTPFDSSNGTDILLIDRINYIYHNDDTQCQSNCQFVNYSIESQYMQCSCSVDENVKYDDSKKDKFNPKKLYESFYEVLKYSNYNILKCYKIITDIKNLTRNFGNIITIIFFSCYLICLFIYIFQGINPFKMKLKVALKNSKGKNNIQFNSNFFDLLYPPIKKKSINKLILKPNKKNNKIIKPKKLALNFKKNNYNKIQIFANSGSKLNADIKPMFNKKNLSKFKKQIINNINKIKNSDKVEYSDYELNNLEYEKAVKLDKRTLFQIYFSTLKREHLIIFTFCNCNDYNLIFVKITRFIFLIVGDMALNTFFFSDDSMHKLFLNYGKYNFIQQIPQIAYSTLISSLIEIFLCYLSLTDKYFYQIKFIFIKGAKNKIRKIIKCIKIKLVIFYIFIFIFLIMYWYIISVFCGIYRNTQIAFIKDSIISFSINLIYPIFLYFLSAILRSCSLENKKKRCKFIYSLSYMIPFF